MAIYLGLGGNLASSAGPPQATLEAALERLEKAGVHTVRRSRFYRSAPHPPSGQPDYINAVAEVSTPLPPPQLLALLHDIEADFGRRRSVPNAARTLDLDMRAYNGRV